MSPIRHADRILYNWVIRSWPRERVEKYVELLRASNDATALPAVVFRNFESIDAKAAALLTHTSMMVAALGVISTVVAEDHAQEAVIILEILGLPGNLDSLPPLHIALP